MKCIYVSKEHAMRGVALVYCVTDKPIEGYRERFLKEHGLEAVEFVGDMLPHYLSFDESTYSVYEATKQEMFERGQYALESWEYLKDGIIKDSYSFPIPEGMIRPEFNTELEQWEETATEADILAGAKHFYRDEVEVYQIIQVDHTLGIVSDEALAECQDYLRTINPHKAMRAFAKITRPEIFSRYE